MTRFLASAPSCTGMGHALTSACRYQVAWSINPHMAIGTVDHHAAVTQHATLLTVVRAVGGDVHVMPFVHGAFDSVFAKDNAVCVSRKGQTHALMASPRHDVRRAEQAARVRTLIAHGMRVRSTAAPFEGGDVCVLPDGRGALLGHGFRSSRDAIGPLRDLLEMPVYALELVDPALYHLDTALTVLADGTALVCHEAFSPAARQRLCSLGFRNVISVERADAIGFALNVVEVSGTVITGTDSPAVAEQLRSLDHRVIYTPLDQFHRAGGSAACLLAPIHPLGQSTSATMATAAIRSTAA